MSGTAAVAVGGRRREALMRHHADREREQRLGAADVAILQRDRSPQARAQVAAKFGRQFDELCAGNDRAVADAVLELLVRDLAVEVRQALATTVAASALLPADVARQLAGRPDRDRAARSSSTARCSATRTWCAWCAPTPCSTRWRWPAAQRLSEMVSEALVDTGEVEVVTRLVENAGASLSQTTHGAGDPGLPGQRADPRAGDPAARTALRAGRAADRRHGRPAGMAADPRAARCRPRRRAR